jgi:hypothetical protein
VIDTATENPDPADNYFTGMVLDHTGANMYVLYSDGDNEGPDYLLNYKVASGKLSFVAATAASGPGANASNEFHVPTVSSNNEFLYSTYQDGIDGANHGFCGMAARFKWHAYRSPELLEQGRPERLAPDRGILRESLWRQG